METPRVHVHEGLGIRLGSLTTQSSVNRAWTLMQPSQASVTCSLADPVLRELDPRRGRAIVIESTHYPVPWVGGVTRIEEDPGSGQATISAVSLDAVLRDRYLAASAAYDNAAGQVFRRIFEDANEANDSGIIVSPDVAVGPPYAGNFPDRSVYGALNALCAQTAHEWGQAYDVNETGIVAAAQFAPALGFDHYAKARLSESGNCERVSSAIDMGSLWALKAVAGQTSATQAYTERSRVTRQQASGQQPRGGAVIGAEASVHGYEVEHVDLGGSPLTRREALVVAESLKSLGAITAATEALLGRSRNAERLVRLRVFGGQDELWALLSIGSVVRFTSSPDAFLGEGFDGPIRIVGVQPMDEIGDMELVCQLLRVKE